MYSDTNRNATQTTIVYVITVDKGLSAKEKEKVKGWLQKRLNTTVVKVVFEE